MRGPWRRAIPALVMCGCLTLTSAGIAPAGVAAAPASPAPAPAPAAAPAPTLIRVGIGRSLSTATIGSTDGYNLVNLANAAVLVTSAQGGTQTLQVDAAGVRLGGAVYPGPLRLAAAAGGYVTFGGRKYRGELEVLRTSQGMLSVVNVLDLEEYLQGVVPQEMNTSWPAEALKAQAVAARTYALVQMTSGKFTAEGFAVSNDTSSQAYGGLEAEVASASAAVYATRGQAVVDGGGKLISAFFHSASGGMTESNEYVWGGAGYSYLRGVPDFDQLSPWYRWQANLTVAEAEQKLKAYSVDVGGLQGIEPYTPAGAPEVSYRSPATGQYKEYLIRGGSSEAKITATHLREALGLRGRVFTLTAAGGAPQPGTLPKAGGDVMVVQGAVGVGSRLTGGSFAVAAGGKTVQLSGGAQLYALRSVPATLTFDGRGYGHGVGLSQWGARGMATLGQDYKAILTHFYSGTQVVQK